MQSKQAEAAVSDVVMKCEEHGVALPLDPFESLLHVIAAISNVKEPETGRLPLDAAVKQLEDEFGIAEPAKPAATRQPKKRANNHATGEKLERPPKKAKHANKPHIQEQIEAMPAICSENQALVDQLVTLGEFELHNGRTQRGIARMRAAKQLHDTETVISSGAQARQLDRIGASAAAKIDAILTEGLKGAMREYEH